MKLFKLNYIESKQEESQLKSFSQPKIINGKLVKIDYIQHPALRIDIKIEN